MKFYKWLNEAKARYYTISVEKNEDNENNIVLYHSWGSCITRRGGKKIVSVGSESDVRNVINQMIKRRKSRGYELLTAA